MWWKIVRKCVRNLLMLLLGYETNGSSLKAWETVERLVCYLLISTFLENFYLAFTNFLSLSDKKSVVLSIAIDIHATGKQGKIKAVPVLTKLVRSLGPC